MTGRKMQIAPRRAMKQNVMRHGRCSLRDEAGRIKRPTAWAGRRGTVGRKVRAANAAAAGRAEGRARAGLGCHPFMSPRNEEKRLKPFRTWSPDEVPAARARRERDVSAEGGEEDETASVPSARFSSPASAAGSLKAAGAEAGPGSRLGEARGPRREPPLRPCRCAGQQRPPERPGFARRAPRATPPLCSDPASPRARQGEADGLSGKA